MDDAAKVIARLTDELHILRQRNAQLEMDNANHQQISDALLLSEARFRLLFEQSPFSTQLLDPDGWTVQVNHAWNALWGVTIEQIRDYNILHDPQLEVRGVMPYIQRGFAGEAVMIPPILYDPEETLPHRSQNADPQRWVRGFIYPVTNQAGHVREVVLIHEDITEQQHAEYALRESEARYRALVENFPNGSVFLFDRELRYIVARGTGLAASGFSPEMFEGKTIWEIFPPEVAARDEPVLRAALQGETTRVEVSFGATTHLVHTLPVMDDTGTIVGGMVMTQDMTDRKRAEEHLRFLAEAGASLGASLDYDETLQNIARLAIPLLGEGCTVFIIAPDGTIQPTAVTHVNPAREEHLRELHLHLAIDREGQHPVAAVIRNGRPAIIPAWNDPAHPEAQDTREQWMGSERVAPVHLVLPLLGYGQVLGALVIERREQGQEDEAVELDLAGELARRATQAIEHSRLYREAQAALRARDEFLSIAAHELKTPLTSLRGYADVLLRACAREQPSTRSEREQRMLRVIVQQSERLQQQIDALLDLSQLGTNRLSLDLRRLDLCPFIERIVDDIKPSLNRHVLLFTCEPSSLFILADEGRLEQVLQNLVQNAIKYSPEGGTIAVQITRQETEIAIKVMDQGIGIPLEAQARLFERFYRAQNAASQGISGLGIGLAVVADIVERHGGKVEVSSVEGQGSTFTVLLPEDRNRLESL